MLEVKRIAFRWTILETVLKKSTSLWTAFSVVEIEINSQVGCEFINH